MQMVIESFLNLQWKVKLNIALNIAESHACLVYACRLHFFRSYVASSFYIYRAVNTNVIYKSY